MKVDNLPDWTTYEEKDNIIIVDPDVVYPLYLEKLGYDQAKLTQHQLETARFCFTEDLLKVTGPGLRLRITKNDNWKLDKFPMGLPIAAGAEYKRISA